MKIIIEAVLEGIASRVDGTVNLKIATQELDSSKAGELFQMRGKYIKCLLSDSNISTMEEELIDATSLNAPTKNKSRSSRLRAVLFRLHEQEASGIDFEQYYNEKMEGLITHFKNKLG
jgi:hypothetical protein